MIFLALSYRSSSNNSPVALYFWCALGFCVGIVLFIRGFRLLQRRRLILDTPSSKIRSASMGILEVSGLAVGPYTMVSPITARPCYYYRTLAWEWKQQGKNEQWVKIAGECMHVPFYVDDNTGVLLVDPRGAELELHRDFEQEFCNSFFTTKDPAPSNVVAFLARHGVATDNKIKVEEFCIKPKNSLFILGTLAENPGIVVAPRPVEDHESVKVNPFGESFSLNISSGSGFREDSFVLEQEPQPEATHTQVIRLSDDSTSPTRAVDMTQQQKIAAALLRAGLASPASWAAAGVTTAGANHGVQVVDDASANAPSARKNDSSSDLAIGSYSTEGHFTENQSTTTTAEKSNGFDFHPPVVMMKGANDRAFLISWRSQVEIAKRLAWQCTLMIWGGPVLALLSLYVFLDVEHLL